MNVWLNRNFRPSFRTRPPDFYSEQDEHGRTVLHRAAAEVHLRGTYSLLELHELHGMISECPKDALLKQESEGETLLHHCVRRGAEGGSKITEGFFSRWRSNKFTVWENLIHVLLVKCPEAAVIQNEDGNTPLHVAVKRPNQWSNDTVRKLLTAGPSTLEMRNKAGETPLTTLWRGYGESYGLRFSLRPTISEEDVLAGAGLLQDQQHLDCALHRSVLSQITTLLTKAWSVDGVVLGSGAKKEWKTVHLCLATLSCPPELMRVVMNLYPYQKSEEDEPGDYPLHLAASNPCLANEHSKAILEDLIHTSGALAAVPNARGQYPLHLASESGKEWDSGVEVIFRAAPHLAAEKDPVSGLFPFMLAAHSKDGVDEPGSGDAVGVDTVYQLLRAWPEMERFTSTGSPEGLHLGTET